MDSSVDVIHNGPIESRLLKVNFCIYFARREVLLSSFRLGIKAIDSSSKESIFSVNMKLIEAVFYLGKFHYIYLIN